MAAVEGEGGSRNGNDCASSNNSNASNSNNSSSNSSNSSSSVREKKQKSRDILRNGTDPGLKPYFIKKLPARVEILEGGNLSYGCRISKTGCRPWFIKKLPPKIEVRQGHHLHMKCVISEANEDSIKLAATQFYKEKLQKQQNPEKATKSAAQPDRPYPPASLCITHLTANSASIEWEAPTHDGGSPIINYILEKREAGRKSWELLTTLPPSVTECELENMVAGKDYYVRVRARNRCGMSDVREITQPINVRGVQKEIPSRPGRPTAVEHGDDYILLTWEPPVSTGGCPILNYILERREVRGPHWVRTHRAAVASAPFLANNLVEGSEYEFRVYAQNAVGTSAASELSKTLVCAGLQDIQPPRYEGDLVSAAVEEGSNAMFEVKVTGKPLPEVRWFKNFLEIFDGYKHQIRNQDGVCTMTVSGVTADDCGEVECRAYNKAGNATIRTNLILQAPAKIHVTPRMQETLNFNRGQSVKIRVPLQGEPTPKVTWAKDGEALEQGGRYELTTSDKYATLIVHESEKGDTGVYTITASNDMGQDEARFDVLISDRPEPPPGKPRVSEVCRNSARVDWDVPAHDGGSIITCYIVERQEKGPAGGGGHWVRCGSTHLTRMTVHRLQENKTYRFRISAENLYGTSDPSEESDDIVTTEPKIDIDYDKLVDQDFPFTKVRLDRLRADVNAKYIVCEELGRGNYSIVHRAIERSTGRNWVAKFVRCVNDMQRELVKHEMEMLNLLHHNRILQLHEAFDQPGEVVVILEFLSGVGIMDRITSPVYQLVECDVIHYTRQVCEAVKHMHRNNVLHLDLKPDYLLTVTTNSTDIKLIDVSSAQIVDPNRVARILVDGAEFTAPEVITSDPVSYPADLWSLGVLAYVLITGVSPFLGATNQHTMANVLKGHIRFENKLWKYVSEEAKDWIQKLVVKDKRKRLTIEQALAHPWLNGYAETKLTKITLPVENHKRFAQRHRQKRPLPDMALSVGRLSHQGAFFRGLAPTELTFEREVTLEMPERAPQVIMELTNTEAYEKTVGRFKCKFQGHPEPAIAWFHDDCKLEDQGGKYDFWYKRGLAMLNINDVTDEDAGGYTCVATNKAGQCTTIGELNVQNLGWRRRRASIDNGSLNGSAGGRTPRSRSWSSSRRSSDASLYDPSRCAPTFTLPLMDQAIMANGNAVFSVLVSSRAECEVTWYHEDHVITGDPQRYLLHDEAGVYKLEVVAVTPEDDGIYRVLAHSPYGKTVCSANLHVIDNIPEGCEPPTFRKRLKKNVVVEGSAVKLYCKVRGKPLPHVTWYKDRQILRPTDSDYKLLIEGATLHSLSLQEAFPEHAGWYMCRATNVAGTVSSEVQLVVDGLRYDDIYRQPRSRPSSITASSVTSDQESNYSASSTARRHKRFDAAPSLTARLRDKRCMEGQTIRFNCSISGLPMPEVTWFRGQRVIGDDDDRFQISNHYGLLSLEIRDVRREDAGLYSIRAGNMEGEVTCSATLSVQEVDTPQERSEGTKKPWFVIEAQNTWAEVGAKAVFEAQATGRPAPTFKWQKDNINLTEDQRTRMLSDEQGHAKLVIKDVKPTDNGLYFCVAQNKAGSAKCAATLKIVEVGQIVDTQGRRRSMSREPTPSRRLLIQRDTVEPSCMTAGMKPWFVQNIPSELTVREGDALTLNCTVDGDPKPIVTWLKGVRELQYSSRHRVVVNHDHHFMQTIATLQTDPGQYIVVAENAAGKTQASCWVNVVPRDTEDFEEIIKKRRIELPDLDYETTIKKELVPMAPKFVRKLPAETELHAGESLEIKCQLKDVVPDVETSIQTKTTVADAGAIVETTQRISSDGTKTVTVDKTQILEEDTIRKIEGRHEEGDKKSNVDVPAPKIEVQPATPDVSQETESKPAEKQEEKVEVVAEEKPVVEIDAPEKEENILVETETTPDADVKPGENVETKAEDTSEEVEAKADNKAEKVEEITDKSEELEVKTDDKSVDVAEKTEPQAGEKPAEVNDTATEQEEKQIEACDEEKNKEKTKEKKEKKKKKKNKKEESESTEEKEEKSPSPIKDQSAPAFDVELSDKEVKSGSTLKLSVKSKDNLHTSISWSKEGVALASEGRYSFSEDDGLICLEVCDVEADDAGVYTCELKNSAGAISSSASVAVKSKSDKKKKKKKCKDDLEDIPVVAVTEATPEPSTPVTKSVPAEEEKSSKDESTGNGPKEDETVISEVAEVTQNAPSEKEQNTEASADDSIDETTQEAKKMEKNIEKDTVEEKENTTENEMQQSKDKEEENASDDKDVSDKSEAASSEKEESPEISGSEEEETKVETAGDAEEETEEKEETAGDAEEEAEEKEEKAKEEKEKEHGAEQESKRAEDEEGSLEEADDAKEETSEEESASDAASSAGSQSEEEAELKEIVEILENGTPEPEEDSKGDEETVEEHDTVMEKTEAVEDVEREEAVETPSKDEEHTEETDNTDEGTHEEAKAEEKRAAKQDSESHGSEASGDAAQAESGSEEESGSQAGSKSEDESESGSDSEAEDSEAITEDSDQDSEPGSDVVSDSSEESDAE